MIHSSINGTPRRPVVGVVMMAAAVMGVVVVVIATIV